MCGSSLSQSPVEQDVAGSWQALEGHRGRQALGCFRHCMESSSSWCPGGGFYLIQMCFCAELLVSLLDLESMCRKVGPVLVSFEQCLNVGVLVCV